MRFHSPPALEEYRDHLILVSCKYLQHNKPPLWVRDIIAWPKNTPLDHAMQRGSSIHITASAAGFRSAMGELKKHIYR